MGQGRQRQRVTIRIENSPPEKISDTEWKSGVWAVVTRGQQGEEGETIRFYQDGEEIESRETDDDGRTVPVVITFGVHGTLIEALVNIEGTISRQRKTITLATAAKKAADQWTYEAAGKDGKYVIIGTVTSSEKIGIRGIRIVAFDTENPDAPHDDRTDDDGAYRIPIEITQRSKTFRVQAMGTQLTPGTVTLDGPRRRASAPSSLPEHLRGEGGIVENLKAVFRIFLKGTKE